jgi:hypothetical protein
MERIITTNRTGADPAAISYEKAASEIEKNDVNEVGEVCCGLLLKNLIKTNLKLINLNDIRSIIFF